MLIGVIMFYVSDMQLKAEIQGAVAQLACSTTLLPDITLPDTWDVPRHKQTLELHE
jgi:hypothetical protein